MGALKMTEGNTRKIEYKERVIKLCFDPESIKNFKPGLKMLCASEDQPLFVNLKNLKVQQPPLSRSL